MQLTDRELANVLTALRSFQIGVELGNDYQDYETLDGHELMNAAEIDELCDKINQ